ncbi:BolA family transcriptional regulator [Candidatus Tenderia electrophaga]|jgi:acid stress-induced BolA-like protein IbaG/YrbA|uniref:BolA family transcriptional regulator n=1 Tax=Candidatus Tenderia electrophaga TaxID=1748243 RepID=A0A0S2THF7_9GAMM|nr:BolA family transcriptional regulator [Candidatus Tenderia electrophaga]
MQAQQIKQMIETGLPGSEVQVLGDDGQHFDAVVVSEAFNGKTMVQQHQLVYATLAGRMESGAIHALGLKTYTPEAWSKAQ